MDQNHPNTRPINLNAFMSRGTQQPINQSPVEPDKTSSSLPSQKKSKRTEDGQYIKRGIIFYLSKMLDVRCEELFVQCEYETPETDLLRYVLVVNMQYIRAIEYFVQHKRTVDIWIDDLTVYLNGKKQPEETIRIVEELLNRVDKDRKNGDAKITIRSVPKPPSTKTN